MTTRLRTIPAAALVLVALLVVGACASSAGPILAPVGDSVERPADLGGAAAPEADGVGSDATGGTGGRTADGVGAAIDDARIVRTGSIDLEVKDVDAAVRVARDGIRAMGGYIGASNTYSEGDTAHPIASITYRVPVDRWEDALELLRALDGQTTRIVAERTEAVEVTGAVADLEARIRNLEASEAALQEILTKAIRITDVLEVQNQLTQVRGQIEQLEAQLKDLEDRADLATLSATYRVPVVAVEAATSGWDPQAVIDDASASLIEIGQALASAGIWLMIVGLPLVLVVGAATLLVTVVVRRVRPGRRGHGTIAG